MGKRRPSIDASQLGFDFDTLALPTATASLAGLDRVCAAAIALGLKDDPRSRFEIAGAMSELLDEDVSKAMLDAYAAESRDTHNISLTRALAFFAVTKRYDLFDALARRIGAAVLVGEEVQAARLGNLRAKKRALDDEIKRLERVVQPIARGGRG